MPALTERLYFSLCRTLGSWLRSARYSTARIVEEDGERRVLKSRRGYAPLLIAMGNALVKILDTGVRVLPQRDWVDRERKVYWRLYGTSVRIDSAGTLVLPYIAGKTLASVLADPALEDSVRWRAIERAVIALAEFHRLGFTHADAMAENVLIDLEPGVARWFDFETIHDANRPEAWRQADDVRALLVTCLMRTDPRKRAATLRLILDTYADEAVTRVLAASFAPILQRPLMFHLAQAGLSLQTFCDVGRLLDDWLRQPRLRA
jgi:hypothetical protein